MAEIDNWHWAMIFYTSIDSKLGGIAFSYLSTLEKIFEISNIEWLDKSLSRCENKIRMKEVGGASMQYMEFLHENSILALAKVVEDTSIELKRSLNFKFDSIRNNHDVIFAKELRIIRALSNVIKHNVSQLDRNSSESARFLVDECGMKNGFTLNVFIHSQHETFNIIEYIPKVYLALLDLVNKATGEKHRLLDLAYEEAFNEIYNFLIPEVSKMKPPQKPINSSDVGT
jgi:hypothetical protein